MIMLDHDYDHLLLVPSWGPDHPKPELSDGLHHQDRRVEIYRVGEFTGTKTAFLSDPGVPGVRSMGPVL